MSIGRPEPHISPRVRALDAARRRAKRRKRADAIITALFVSFLVLGSFIIVTVTVVVSRGR